MCNYVLLLCYYMTSPMLRVEMVSRLISVVRNNYCEIIYINICEIAKTF